jgi:DnaK suppressor protein
MLRMCGRPNIGGGCVAFDVQVQRNEMRLICPKCAAQYDVQNSAIPAEGREVRCSSCETTWFEQTEITATTSHPSNSTDRVNLISPTQLPKVPAHAQSERKLPVYLLVDCSASMCGEPIAAVNNGIAVLLGSLRQDKYLYDTITLTILKFDAEVDILIDCEPIKNVRNPEFLTTDAQESDLDLAFEEVLNHIQYSIDLQKHTAEPLWAPHILIVTQRDAHLDIKVERANELRKRTYGKIIGCFTSICSYPQEASYFYDQEVHFDTLDGHSFIDLFSFIDVSIEQSNNILLDDGDFLSEQQIQYFRNKLQAWRDEIISAGQDVQARLSTSKLPNLGDRASADIDLDIQLRAHEQQIKFLVQIEAALWRIQQGDFGYCEVTGEPISFKRLDAWPIATMTVEAQQHNERRKRH